MLFAFDACETQLYCIGSYGPSFACTHRARHFGSLRSTSVTHKTVKVYENVRRCRTSPVTIKHPGSLFVGVCFGPICPATRGSCESGLRGPHTRAIAHARRRATVHTLGPVARI